MIGSLNISKFVIAALLAVGLAAQSAEAQTPKLKVEIAETTVAGDPLAFFVTVVDADNGDVDLIGYSGTLSVTVTTDTGESLPPDETVSNPESPTVWGNSVLLSTAGVRTLTFTGTNAANVVKEVTVLPGPVSYFEVAGYPASTIKGVSHPFTVKAFDEFMNPATNYVGTVHFSSFDGLAVLPANYQFTVGDNGEKEFSAAFGTVGAGAGDIKVEDTENSFAYGNQTGITVDNGITFEKVESVKGHGVAQVERRLTVFSNTIFSPVSESRSGGITKLVFTCTSLNDVIGTGEEGAPQETDFEVTNLDGPPPTDWFAGAVIDGNVVTLILQNLPAKIRMRVRLAGIKEAESDVPVTDELVVHSLYADVNSSQTVEAGTATAADYVFLKAQVLKAITNSNCMCDLKRDGKIDALDLNLLRGQNGQTLP